MGRRRRRAGPTVCLKRGKRTDDHRSRFLRRLRCAGYRIFQTLRHAARGREGIARGATAGGRTRQKIFFRIRFRTKEPGDRGRQKDAFRRFRGSVGYPVQKTDPVGAFHGENSFFAGRPQRPDRCGGPVHGRILCRVGRAGQNRPSVGFKNGKGRCRAGRPSEGSRSARLFTRPEIYAFRKPRPYHEDVGHRSGEGSSGLCPSGEGYLCPFFAGRQVCRIRGRGRIHPHLGHPDRRRGDGAQKPSRQRLCAGDVGRRPACFERNTGRENPTVGQDLRETAEKHSGPYGKGCRRALYARRPTRIVGR